MIIEGVEVRFPIYEPDTTNFSLRFSEQKPKESNCGHHCVSMITKLPIDVITEEMKKKKGTQIQDVSWVIRRFGYDCDVTLSKFLSIRDLPELAVLCSRVPQGSRRGSHWSIYFRGEIWDSCVGVFTANQSNLKLLSYNITKYFKVYI